VHYIDTSAIRDRDRLHLFVTNRSLTESARVRLEISDASIVGRESAEILTCSDQKSANSFEQPHTVVSSPFDGVTIENGDAIVNMAPLSLAALTLRLRGVG
jgi:alpha-L-arabinofuranosidase